VKIVYISQIAFGTTKIAKRPFPSKYFLGLYLFSLIKVPLDFFFFFTVPRFILCVLVRFNCQSSAYLRSPFIAGSGIEAGGRHTAHSTGQPFLR
jgi:hypothetical protein